MKTIVAIAAVLVTLAFGAPAHADVWDFTWTLKAQFGPNQGGQPAVTREASGSSIATITQQGGGLAIGFGTEIGQAGVSVTADGSAVGAVPIFACRDCPLSLERGDFVGTYSATGAFANPDTFFLRLSSGGSGAAGFEQFGGTGTRRSVSTPEPVTLFTVLGGLAIAAVVRRRRR